MREIDLTDKQRRQFNLAFLVSTLSGTVCWVAVLWFFVWLAVSGAAQFNHWLDGVLKAVK